MSRYTYTRPAERLMTIEEAQQLSVRPELVEGSGLDGRTESQREREARRSIWTWQTVEGVLSQTVTEAQVDEVLKKR